MTGGVLLGLARRNLRRNVRRSLLSAAAMVVAGAILVFSRALAEGGHESWIDAGVRLGSGHVALQSPGYRERATLDERMDEAAVDSALAAVRDPMVAERTIAVAPRLSVQGLASSAESAVPVGVIGVDPDAERSFSRLQEKLEAGRYLEEGDRLRAYVGTKLADRLGLRPGSRFVLTAQDATGEISGQMVRVAGVFRTGLPEVDEGMIQIPLSTAREWLRAPGAATEVGVLLASSRDARPVERRLREELAGTGIAVLDWTEAMPELEAAVRMDDYSGDVLYVILFVIAALAIINSVLMSVLHRTREMGVLRALGLLRSEVGRLVFVEGVLLTVAAGLLGMAIGAAVTWGVFGDGLDFSSFMSSDLTAAGAVLDPVVVPAFHPVQLLTNLGFVIAIGALASIYPAWRATRIDVAEAMKFEE